MKYKTERNNKIYELYKSGNYSYAAIGRMYNLSRDRIREIVLHQERIKRHEVLFTK